MNFVLLAASGQPNGGNGFFLMIAMMFVVMYFFMIRPQVKKNKQQQAYRDNLSKGDRIVTSGGIHGKIAELKDTTLIIETEGGGKLRIEKSAVSMDATSALNAAKEGKK
ncbi:MAG: preprotein translocase subunit YajC [Flavobacteriales bacterium]|nr:preprotein translocase subunit YajC [Bacteroidota bacterium]MCB9241777.1 preprotein translocase subunit YajC [Flavobacteriales bacterium]